MFTSEPSLAQRLERMIGDTPIIDPHTHLRCDQPQAPDLASLMGYHWVQSELIAVGMGRTDLDPSLPAEERVRRAIPYLRRMRNTAMAWCFYRILRDLYDFDEPHITDGNYRDLCKRVEATGGDPAWPRSVLERCRIKTYVTSLGNRGTGPAGDPEDVRFMLDAHYLFCPGVATDLMPFFPGRMTKGSYFEALRDLGGGEGPDSSARLESVLTGWLDRTFAGHVRFTNIFLPIEARFSPGDRGAVDAILSRASRGVAPDDAEVDALVRFVSWTILGWHHEARKAFQIAVGAEYFICDGKSLPRYRDTWVSEMAQVFHHFPGARFDLLTASDLFAHEAAVMARQFPNVYTSGYWWHTFFPGTIERAVALRLQIAPMTKFGGFLCDAYYVEWTYGKLQVVRKAMARAMAGLVESGFYEEDELPPILGQILHDTPRDLYDLGSR